MIQMADFRSMPSIVLEWSVRTLLHYIVPLNQSRCMVTAISGILVDIFVIWSPLYVCCVALAMLFWMHESRGYKKKLIKTWFEKQKNNGCETKGTGPERQ